MKLTDDQYKKLVAFVESKWNAPFLCPYCRTNSWDVGKEVYEAREFQGGNLNLTKGRILVFCPFVCKTCGNTVMINAGVAQIPLGDLIDE